ncbi:LamG domain-containing protein [Paraflavisolibacter sp. H34]|uniref:LamG domain-containing protein n=1 Tax=Huijunlia imazamoxiresistens TaxID=3127457 RepID=UPI0030179768
MKRPFGFTLPVLALLLVLGACGKDTALPGEEAHPAGLRPEPISEALAAKTYDQLVLAAQPSGYWLLTKGQRSDASGNGLTGSYFGGGRGEARLPNGETASVFNGSDSYFEIPDHRLLEVTRTGVLTIEAWMRPDVADFPASEGDGYVHWMGKGTLRNQLWAARMYNAGAAGRSQRISGYCFNLAGSLGAGSYFQEAEPLGAWIHYALVINTVQKSAAYPSGYTRVYKNGVLRDTDGLHLYAVVPGDGTAPMRVGTRDGSSFFKGAIGKVAVYGYELPASVLLAHNQAMRARRKPR